MASYSGPAAHRRRAGGATKVVLGLVSVAALVLAVPVHAARAAEAPMAADVPLTDVQLDELRGGFSFGPFVLNFGFSIRTIVRNAVDNALEGVNNTLQGIEVVTTFTMSTPGVIENLQTTVSGTPDQTFDTTGLNGAGNVTVANVSADQFNSNANQTASSPNGSVVSIPLSNAAISVPTPPAPPPPAPVVPAPEVVVDAPEVVVAVAPPPVPVAVVAKQLAGGGHEISVGDETATQIVQSVSLSGLSSIIRNRISNKLIQENLGMDVLLGGGLDFTIKLEKAQIANRIGRGIGLFGLRK